MSIRSAVACGAWHTAAVAITSAGGSWQATLHPGPSRLIQATYAGGPDTEAASSAVVKMIVPAKVVLTHVTRRVPWGGVLVIRGRLLGRRDRTRATTAPCGRIRQRGVSSVDYCFGGRPPASRQPHRLRKQHGDGGLGCPSRVDSRTAGAMQPSATRSETTPFRSYGPSGWPPFVPARPPLSSWRVGLAPSAPSPRHSDSHADRGGAADACSPEQPRDDR
jgi:hypothetical protein